MKLTKERRKKVLKTFWFGIVYHSIVFILVSICIKKNNIHSDLGSWSSVK
jgi:hypothetical protein